MDKRLALLVFAGLVIAGLSAHKLTRTYPARKPVRGASTVMPAPPFELYDQSSPSRLVRLASYLGRQQVFVVFFDGEAGPHRSAPLKRLADDFERLRKAGAHVMAISTALPQTNRKTIADHGAFPFPLLSDPGLQAHQSWGRVNEATGSTQPGVFLVDRAGNVQASPAGNHPIPLDDWEAVARRVVEGQ